MGQEFKILTPLHQSTTRDYLSRMNDEKVEAMRVARQFDTAYWDGSRRYGYGGYRHIPGRWSPVASALVNQYGLSAASTVLDIGCGKGFLIQELARLVPGLRVSGLDYSHYALSNSHPDVRGALVEGDARFPLPFSDDAFDLSLSLATLHNFRLPEICVTLGEMTRVSRRQFVMVESYRNETELFNLQCWALTASSFLDPDEWRWIFSREGYDGDYEFIYFS